MTPFFNSETRPVTIEEIKKELIGRHNDFVVLQELDKKRREVVPASTPLLVEPIQLVDVDWRQGTLILKLNREPEHGWIQRFQNPRGSWSSTMGAEPHNFRFNGDTATIQTREQDAQQIVNHFKEYVEMATRGLSADLASQAKRIEMEQRERLRREVEEAEARARLRKNLKF